MTEWNLTEHGDARERRLWPDLADDVPAYEQFWRKYVAPQTFRVVDPAIHLVRPSAQWPELADYNYAAFSHVGGAKEVLDLDDKLEESESIYAYTSRLYSASEATSALVKESTKVMGEYGGAQVPRLERWFAATGSSDVWTAFLEAVERVGEYRNPHVHQVEIIRVGDRLPKREYLENYKHLSALASAIVSPEVVAEQFGPAVETLTGLYDDLVAAMDAVWLFLSEQFASLPQHNRLLENLSAVSDDDKEVLSKLQRPERDAPSGSTRVTMVRRRSGGGGPTGLSAQGPEDLDDDWPR